MHLEAPLVRPQAEVRDDDAHRLAADLEVDVERAARLVAGPAPVVVAHGEDLAAGQQRVADVPVVPLVRRAVDHLHAESCSASESRPKTSCRPTVSQPSSRDHVRRCARRRARCRSRRSRARCRRRRAGSRGRAARRARASWRGCPARFTGAASLRGHVAEPALHRDRAAEQQAQHAAHHPPVDRARAATARSRAGRRRRWWRGCRAACRWRCRRARCQSFRRTAPATMPSTANGASGTRRSSVIASRPCFFSTATIWSSFGAGEAPHGVAPHAPADEVGDHRRRARCRSARRAKPSQGPKATTANSVISGRGNMTKQAGV